MNRRYANGFTANMAVSFTRTRSNRTVNEFDREPTLWLDDNSSRPYRLSGGAVYELPFGANRRWLSDGGIVAALAGGWQLAGTFERQPGSLITFTTNTNGAPGGNVSDEHELRQGGFGGLGCRRDAGFQLRAAVYFLAGSP